VHYGAHPKWPLLHYYSKSLQLRVSDRLRYIWPHGGYARYSRVLYFEKWLAVGPLWKKRLIQFLKQFERLSYNMEVTRPHKTHSIPQRACERFAVRLLISWLFETVGLYRARFAISCGFCFGKIAVGCFRAHLQCPLFIHGCMQLVVQWLLQMAFNLWKRVTIPRCINSTTFRKTSMKYFL
jgi:hypothetical protein